MAQNESGRQELIALFEAGRIAEIEVAARRLVTADAEFGFGWMALGIAVHVRGGDALPMLRRAAALMPEDAEAHNNLGNALRDRGELEEAIVHYRRAVERAPDSPQAHNNLGLTLKALGRLDEAMQSYRQALAASPEYADAHGNLGNVLHELGRLDEAAACHRRALEFMPDSPEAHTNLGLVLAELGKLEEAAQSHRRALEIEPAYATAHSNLGVVLTDLGRVEEALGCHRRALELRPDFAAAHLNLGNAFKELGRMEEALASYRRALEAKPGYLEAHSNFLFTMGFLQSQPPAVMKAEARKYGALVAAKCRPFADWPALADRDPERPLNVGLVSGDLRNHPVGFFVESVLSALPADRIRLAGYPTQAKADRVTERIKGRMARWTPAMGVGDAALAERIRADGIDILVDLSGHTAHNRLPVFAWRPAPVQVSWLGYFATTGVPGMDYVLADPWSVPPGEEAHFTEEVWRLPETRQCFTPPADAGAVAALPALASGEVCFGSFHQLAKINDAVLEAWARVLHEVPRSRLFLKANQLNDALAQDTLCARFLRQGIADSRVGFEGYSPLAAYYSAYDRVDIALDAFPYPGGTTTMDALWMGVPVLTLKGDRMLAHQGEGLLANAGLGDWVAADADDFVRRAARHAADLEALARLRASLREKVRTSPLLDAPRFARHFEAALRGMWRRRCEQARE